MVNTLLSKSFKLIKFRILYPLSIVIKEGEEKVLEGKVQYESLKSWTLIKHFIVIAGSKLETVTWMKYTVYIQFVYRFHTASLKPIE